MPTSALRISYLAHECKEEKNKRTHRHTLELPEHCRSDGRPHACRKPLRVSLVPLGVLAEWGEDHGPEEQEPPDHVVEQGDAAREGVVLRYLPRRQVYRRQREQQ